MASTDSQIDKPQCGRPKRAELQDVNMNTGAAQSIYAKRPSLNFQPMETNAGCYRNLYSIAISKGY